MNEPLFPQDFECEAFYLEQQQLAALQYQEYLKKRGITEAEHESEIMGWCDAQD